MAAIAISLQLALHPSNSLLHPCLYDEVDAALDARRACALASWLSRRQRGQSIVVSHRPEMIEAAGLLIGCYINEEGASRTISWSPSGCTKW
mmetsp:Transcript_10999/g.31999  ORF Transcript_10999/g.31999 Transcript_10999/m.31999 type:complete len:92 (+) Transcript_10999:4294-4569(+)|eukprot:scaffold2325_cov30-Tisochrysis_lutea.AAC.3